MLERGVRGDYIWRVWLWRVSTKHLTLSGSCRFDFGVGSAARDALGLHTELELTFQETGVQVSIASCRHLA